MTSSTLEQMASLITTTTATLAARKSVSNVVISNTKTDLTLYKLYIYAFVEILIAQCLFSVQWSTL